MARERIAAERCTSPASLKLRRNDSPEEILALLRARAPEKPAKKGRRSRPNRRLGFRFCCLEADAQRGFGVSLSNRPLPPSSSSQSAPSGPSRTARMRSPIA